MTRMKARFFCLLALLLLLLPCASAEDGKLHASVPDEVLEHIESWDPGARLLDYRALPGGEYAFALIDHGSLRELLGFREENGRLVNWLDTDRAIPQSNLSARFFYSLPGDEYDVLYPGGETRTLRSDGLNIGVYTTDGESMIEYVSYEYREDGFLLTEYRRGACVNVIGDELVFFDVGSGYETTVRCYLPRDIRFTDFSALPGLPDEARLDPAKIPAEGTVPEGTPFEGYDPAHALLARNVSFTPEERFFVYAGPGKQYGRAANGKAAVSTNGWIQVFGEYDGWLMIQYAVGDTRWRIGWITKNALPQGVSVPPLNLIADDVYTLSGPWALTDDPLCSRAKLCTLPGDASVSLLAWLGDDWAYVRTRYRGKTWWGFLPAALLGHG